MTETPRGASTWERTIFELMQSHGKAEEQVERDYRQLASSVGAADVRFLIELILEDEGRHHQWFGQLSNAITALIEMEPTPEIPWIEPLSDPGTLLESTKRFLAVERADAKELRHMLKELQVVEDTTLWALVVRLMLLDTEKHIEILRFIERRAKSGTGQVTRG